MRRIVIEIDATATECGDCDFRAPDYAGGDDSRLGWCCNCPSLYDADTCEDVTSGQRTPECLAADLARPADEDVLEGLGRVRAALDEAIRRVHALDAGEFARAEGGHQ